MKELLEIQRQLNAPKDQRNDFGHYAYRTCEGILAAVKNLLYEHQCVLTLSDDVKEVGSPYDYSARVSDNRSGKTSESVYHGTRVYVVATATLTNSAGEKISVSAMAREDVAKAGMDVAQITGAASSYARKYALCGLFAIDGNDDPDRLNTDEKYTNPAAQAEEEKPKKQARKAPAKQAQPEQPAAPAQPVSAEDFAKIVAQINKANTLSELLKIHNDNPALKGDNDFLSALSSRKKKIKDQNQNAQ